MRPGICRAATASALRGFSAPTGAGGSANKQALAARIASKGRRGGVFGYRIPIVQAARRLMPESIRSRGNALRTLDEYNTPPRGVQQAANRRFAQGGAQPLIVESRLGRARNSKGEVFQHPLCARGRIGMRESWLRAKRRPAIEESETPPIAGQSLGGKEFRLREPERGTTRAFCRALGKRLWRLLVLLR